MALTTVRPQGMGFNTGRRNLVINGAMQVFQRATSATTMTNDYGAVDRFRGFSNGGGAFTGEKYDLSTSEIATTGHYQALKMLVSTADTSISAAEYYALAYKFEGDDLLQLRYGTSSARSFTVSFWVKSDTTGTYFLTVDKIANGNTAYRLPIEYTISSADTWEQKVITVSPTAGSTSLITSSAGVIGGDNGHGLSLYWGFAWGTDYHGSNNTWGTGTYGTNATANGWMGTVGNDFYITGVQVELGDNASDFEHRSYSEELQLCKRYFERFERQRPGAGSESSMALWAGPARSGASNVQGPLLYAEKRNNPSVSVSSAGHLHAIYPISPFNSALSGFAIDGVAGTQACFMNCTGGGSPSTDCASFVYIANGAGYVDVDAEL